MKGKRGLIVAIIALAVVLIIIGAVIIIKKSNQSTSTAPSTTNNLTTSQNGTTNPVPSETPVTDPAGGSKTTNTTAADPATLTSVDVTPFNIAVFYSKGTPRFEYSVLKTAGGTQYVQFTSIDLVGTKCTNDQGVFASIIMNPSANESQTISQTVKVASDTYGLSLPSSECTPNNDLLQQYQTGFKNGFASLKAL